MASWRWPAKDKEKWIDEIGDAYATVYANLEVLDPNYPRPRIQLAGAKEVRRRCPLIVVPDALAAIAVAALILSIATTTVYTG